MKSNKQSRNHFYHTLLFLLLVIGLLGCMKDHLPIPTIPPTAAIVETLLVLELLPTPPNVSLEQDPLFYSK